MIYGKEFEKEAYRREFTEMVSPTFSFDLV
jgi:hypothetical protein